jgi:hypothetical protein
MVFLLWWTHSTPCPKPGLCCSIGLGKKPSWLSTK